MAVPVQTLLGSALPLNGQNTWLRELVERETEARSEHLGVDDRHCGTTSGITACVGWYKHVETIDSRSVA